MPSHHRFAIALATSALLLCQPLFAFDSPLSPEAIRDAYFLGQRHDETFAQALAKYTLSLDPPKSGPYIQSVTLLTPYAQIVRASNRTSNYSAQQAQLDYLGKPETITVSVVIYLTDSYPAVLTRPTGSRTAAPTGFVFRPSSFWRDFVISVYPGSGDQTISPSAIHGQSFDSCSDNACVLAGATVDLEFPADAFSSDATIQIDPPEGDQVVVSFDLSSIR